MALAEWVYGGMGGRTASLGSLGTTGLDESDYVDTAGYAGRIVFAFTNADASNDLVVSLEGSVDGAKWGTVAYAVKPSDGTDVTAFTATKNITTLLPVEPWRAPRFLRVATADTDNTTATAVVVFAECG